MNDYQSYKQYKSTRSSGSTTGRSKEQSGKNKRISNKPPSKVSSSKSFQNKTSKNKPSKSKSKDPQQIKKDRMRDARRKAEQRAYRESLKKQKLEEKENKKLEKQKRKQEFQHALKNNFKLFLGACFVVFYIMIAMLILYNNSNIAQLQYKINAIKKDIEKEKNYLNELEAERESTYKSETIENYAKYRLNMVYPSKEQIVYIKVD